MVRRKPKLKGIAKKWADTIKLGSKKTKTSYYKKDGAWKPETINKIPAQFIAQPSDYVQKIKLIREGKTSKRRFGMQVFPMRLKYEKGKTLTRLKGMDKEWLMKNNKKITRELAKAMAELNLKYGVEHADLMDWNILVRETKSGPKIKLIDFEASREWRKQYNKPKMLWLENESNKNKKNKETKEPILYGANKIKVTVKSMAKTKKERKQLWEFYKKEYEKAANRILK